MRLSPFLVLMGLLLPAVQTYAGEEETRLPYYIKTAQQRSPLLMDYANQARLSREELSRLKEFYTRSRLEMNGDFLFVPIVETTNGQTRFQWNATDATDYYGYDLAQSNGYAQIGLTWTKPLLGKPLIDVAEERARIEAGSLAASARMESHELARAVTEQYLLCMEDLGEAALADSTALLLDRWQSAVKRLAVAGMAKQTDLQLTRIEQMSNEALRAQKAEDYRSHLAALRLLCGITDTSLIRLEAFRISQTAPLSDDASLFMEKYRFDSLSTQMELRSFQMQYRPQLNLFIDGGMRTAKYETAYRRFGISAGLTFTWLLSDGKQRDNKRRQASIQLSTIRGYSERMKATSITSRNRCLTEIRQQQSRLQGLQRQEQEYARLLQSCRREMETGQLSVIDYLTLLRNRIQLQRDLQLSDTNIQLLINAYNYWNW